MHIRIVDYALVAADYEQVKQMQNTSHPTSRSQRFNTAHHTRLDILPIMPESATFTHAEPPWTAYGYVLWHPLIARSQKMSESHVVQIPGFLYQDLMRCHAAWLSTNRIPAHLVVETVETWKATRAGRLLMSFLDGKKKEEEKKEKKKWFIRLDHMSPKDSPFGGTEPSSSLEDVVVKLCSSMRACACLEFEHRAATAKGVEEGEMDIPLVLNQWDEDMHPSSEFRVFVAPPSARGVVQRVTELKVCAVSQYAWHSPFKSLFGLKVEETAGAVCAGAAATLEDIKTFMADELDQRTASLLTQYGFSFDVALQRDGSVKLIEVNPFGALSGCGACLFNWVRDGRILYGLAEHVVFAVTLDECEKDGQKLESA